MLNIKKQLITLGTLGDSGVGKTNISNIFFDIPFTEENISTIGVNNFVKRGFEIKPKLNPIKITIKLWDTAGQERFRSISTQYIKNCDGIFLVYAINNRESFDRIENWIKEVDEKKNSDNEVPLILIGNKCDIDDLQNIDNKFCREVTFNEGEKLAQRYGIKFFECSAKKNININESFNYLIDQIVNIHKDEFPEFPFDENNKNLDEEKNNEGCCKKKNKKKNKGLSVRNN